MVSFNFEDALGIVAGFVAAGAAGLWWCGRSQPHFGVLSALFCIVLHPCFARRIRLSGKFWGRPGRAGGGCGDSGGGLGADSVEAAEATGGVVPQGEPGGSTVAAGARATEQAAAGAADADAESSDGTGAAAGAAWPQGGPRGAAGVPPSGLASLAGQRAEPAMITVRELAALFAAKRDLEGAASTEEPASCGSGDDCEDDGDDGASSVWSGSSGGAGAGGAPRPGERIVRRRGVASAPAGAGDRLPASFRRSWSEGDLASFRAWAAEAQEEDEDEDYICFEGQPSSLDPPGWW